MSKIEELYERGGAMVDEMNQIQHKYGYDKELWPAGQRNRWDNLQKATQRAFDEVKVLEARATKVAEVQRAAQEPSNREAGAYDGSGFISRAKADPWAAEGDILSRGETVDGLRERAFDAIEYVTGVPVERRQWVANLLGGRDEDDPVALEQSRAASLYVLASSAPQYRSAFLKVLRNPQHGFLSWTAQERDAYARTEAVRTAMSLSNANGGYLVPFTLDPAIVLTNTGALNPWRELATVKTTATNTWNGVTSAGVNAAWLSEGTEAADSSPTVGNISIATQKAAAWVYGSYEVLADSDFATQLPALLDDAKNRLEEAAFATGSGTGQPKGVITAAVAASKTVNTAAVGTFAAGDVYKPFDAVPDRYYANASVVCNKSIGLKIRQFDTAGGSSFWANLGGGTPEMLLGRSYRESSSMSNTVATGNKVMLVGDLSQYYIADRLGTVMIYEPLVKGANQRPTGQAGWFTYWRVGADVANADAFRVLNVQ